MRILSASEAINPAINRTKAVLFQPFQWGRSWKLAATAYLSVMGAFFLPTPLFTLGSFSSASGMGLPAAFLSLGAGILFSALMFLFFYVGARLEFVLFDIVLLNEKFVAPSWRRHSHQAWRWIGFKVLFSVVVAVVCGPLFFITVRNLVQHFPTTVPGEPPPPEFIGNLFLFYALIGFPLALALLCSSLLTNFVLPSIALENTAAREGLRRFFALFRTEPGPVALYVILKIALSIAAFVAMEAAILIVEFIAAIPLGLIALLGWFLLRSAGDAGHLMMLTGAILLLALFGAFLFYCGMLVMGSIHVFLQAYALYFLGGRYPLLGDMLEPPSPAFPYIAPPASPPPHFEPIIPPPPEPTA